MSALILLQQMAVIVLLVLIGVYLQKRGVLDDLTAKKMSTIMMDVVNPAQILACILGGGIEATHADLINAIVVGVILYFILCVLGFLLPRILPIQKKERKFYNMMIVYTNIGFMGIPVAKAILPENAMLYVIVCNVLFCLLFYTHGVQVLGGKSEKINVKAMASPGTIMSVLTLVIFWFDLSLPQVISNTVVYVGNATVFFSMILLGAAIAKSSIGDGLRVKGIWCYIVLRMIAVPVILVFVLRMFRFDTDMIQAFCLMAAMPVANLPLIQAEKIGEETKTLSQGIVVSTILCFVTITVLMSVLFQ